jgi:hypothetical protein
MVRSSSLLYAALVPQRDPAWLRNQALKAWRETERAIARGDIAAAERAKIKALFWETALHEVHVLHVEAVSVNNRFMTTGAAAEPKTRGPRPSGSSPIKKAADRLGLSLGQLAKKLGKPEGTVRTWHNRAKPLDDDTRAALAKLTQ